MAENGFADLMRFFSKDSGKKCEVAEFKEFWASLTEEEREYYKQADLG